MPSPLAQSAAGFWLSVAEQSDRRIVVAMAEEADRPAIYALRHQIYGAELGQHPLNLDRQLSDGLDEYNVYVKAIVGECMAGFVSITPPGRSYSVDKYFARADLPLSFDDGLYEVRLLTVAPGFRRRAIAALLMYGALRWVESRSGIRIVAIGRREILSLYRKAGLEPVGRSAQAGAVTYDLLSATTSDLRRVAKREKAVLTWLEKHADWKLSVPFHRIETCSHGGASIDALGEDFDRVDRSQSIINADVLDAWFAPSPQVISAIQEQLPWLVRTSPPIHCAGLVRAIARARRIPPECVVPAAGSSELIFVVFRQWLNRNSRVLVLDPTYGEYAHVAENVIRCRVDRLPLLRENRYALQPVALEAQIAAKAYDLVVIVNPNSPSGHHVSREILERTLAGISVPTRVWLDETYVDYTDPNHSLEGFAAQSRNVVVCKSMSKVYALSGVRAAYLCAPEPIAEEIRGITPPWAVSLPGQLAAIRALGDPEYYAARYRETKCLREVLSAKLLALGMEVVPGAANFLLCHLPEQSANAAAFSQRCRERGLYIRDASEISPLLGPRAVRIAVKDELTNQRMVEIFKWALRNSN
jgi:histidinol-phosphate/aromatic aminotransferase/cobyric acid decarboxylase-like protein/GNAT superfamily N-acetyltransferase